MNEAVLIPDPRYFVSKIYTISLFNSCVYDQRFQGLQPLLFGFVKPYSPFPIMLS